MTALDLESVPACLQAALERDWGSLCELHQGSDALEALYARIHDDRQFRHRFTRVLCCSQYVALALGRHPGLLAAVVAGGEFERHYAADEFQLRCNAGVPEQADEATLMKALRDLRRREMTRIIWRDLTRTADLQQTTRDLSLLAEACLDAAIKHIHGDLVRRHGEPRDTAGSAQRLAVIGMGKLGAHELNLSSDIDLIFAFPEPGETDGAQAISNQEFFTRLGQRVIKVIDTATADGFVFRVDMRLRPYGDSGALALSFDAMEEYYQEQGRDWERYAMIKARTVAGDRVAGERLLVQLRPFVYRRYLDFSAIEALRGMKNMISREVVRRGKSEDVKLGAGGIREIEFIAQCFQLIRGGREMALQERRLLPVLQLLAELQHLPAAVADELAAAYVLLRNTEHVLQAYADAQTQSLPRDEQGRARVAYAMGFDDWQSFAALLAAHRQRVSAHFAEVIAPPRQENQGAGVSATDWRAVWNLEKDADALAGYGFEAAAQTLQLLADLRGSRRLQTLQPQGRERLDRLLPLLLQCAAATTQPSTVIGRIMPLVESVLRRSAYLVLLVENPAALEQLVRLCSASAWIAQELANHPLLLDELLDPRTLYQLPDRSALRDQLRQHLSRIAMSDLEAQMEALRHFKLAHDLRCAASEVTEALPLMKVSDYLSFQAEAILAHVLTLAWQHLVTRHGTPQKSPGIACDPDFIIVAYGKLGGIELGHGSDLDLVFIHDADSELMTDGENAVENSVFFTRLGQRIIHVLTTFTALGALYEVDMRLRPSGAAGLLVSSLQAFRDYQQNQAWTWEHQALVRARAVAGCPELARRFDALRRDVLAVRRDPAELRREVREMRGKMREHLLKAETGGGNSPRFHLKQSVGGIVDIEFMVQYCVLAWSGEHPALGVYTDNIRILEALSDSGLLPGEDARLLTQAYKAYRTAVHRLTLQKHDEIVPAAEFQPLRDGVMRIWHALLDDSVAATI